MKHIFLTILAVVVIGGGCALQDTTDVGERSGEGVVEFTVIARNMSFSPRELRVREGDIVRITFENAQGYHNFVLDEFDIKTDEINAGESRVVEFVADKVGTFEFYCGVPSHRQMGMVGTFIVEARESYPQVVTESVSTQSGGYMVYDPARLTDAIDGSVILYFHSTQCASCRMIDVELSRAHIPDNVTILKLEYAREFNFRNKYGVTAPHTFVQINERGDLITSWTDSSTFADIVAQIQ